MVPGMEKATLPPSNMNFVSRDGTFLAERVGLPRRFFGDLYHYLLTTSWFRLLGFIFLFYVVSNLGFACLYLLGGHSLEGVRPHSFGDVFFFSVQTMATIGYGKMIPTTTYAHILVTVEALFGLMGLAMATGLMFAKFSRPTARVLFSKVAVVSKRDGVPCLMLRMANERGNQIVEAQLHVVLTRSETTQEGETVRRFYELPLARDHNVIFALTWTALHVIDKDSPLYGATAESLRAQNMTLLVSFLGLDETFAQTVHTRYVYHADHILWGQRLVDILSRSEEGLLRVDYTKFHDTQPAPL